MTKEEIDFLVKYEKKRFCSHIEDLCPYNENCTKCDIKIAVNNAKSLAEKNAKYYKEIITKGTA